MPRCLGETLILPDYTGSITIRTFYWTNLPEHKGSLGSVVRANKSDYIYTAKGMECYTNMHDWNSLNTIYMYIYIFIIFYILTMKFKVNLKRIV